MNVSQLSWAADEIYRTLRVMAATVITVPATVRELGFADQIVVISNGTLAQSGRPAEVYGLPATKEAAATTGDVTAIPISIREKEVSSPIGSWDVENPPFQGAGVALARPHHFEIARAGEESDFVFSVEEASFMEGRWLATGMLTGGNVLRVSLSGNLPMSKGKLLALRYDPSRFTLLAV
jgi:ABC-type Fe3+/spermidine/putrescine transport system ATPase subunit